jgi:hypothetical protein
MEKKVSEIYTEAYDDISKKWNDFMKSHYPKLKSANDKLQEALKSGNKDEIAEAKALYERTAKNITVNNRRFQSMSDDVAAKLSHTNEVALSYINNKMPAIYTKNYNAFGDEVIDGYSFSLVNEDAVRVLAISDKALLPSKKIDIPKDMQWNKKMINSQVMQGIIQGESIPKLANRLMNVTDMDRASAIRNARTMTTAAENKGRQDSFKQARSDGIVMKRRWVATNDERTRAWHTDLSGVEVDIDEPWQNDFGEIMFPGDPKADPCNVYNCRCAMRAVIKGFDWGQSKNDDELLPIVDNKPPTQEGLELYASFINAGDLKPTYTSADIHRFAGYNPFVVGEYDAAKADIEKLRALDTVFVPAKNEGIKYKGSSMTKETIDRLNGHKDLRHSYSSTTLDKTVARDYADRAYDINEWSEDVVYPVIETIRIDDGVPIANTLEILGEGGMRNFEKEITIGRETIWEYGKFEKHGSDDDDIYYTVDVFIKKRK